MVASTKSILALAFLMSATKAVIAANQGDQDSFDQSMIRFAPGYVHSDATLSTAHSSDLNDFSSFASGTSLTISGHINRQIRWQNTEPGLGGALPEIEGDGQWIANYIATSAENPLWYSSTGLTDQGRELIDLIANSSNEGINAELISSINIDSWQSAQSSQNPETANKSLNDAFIRFSEIMGSGLVNPQITQKEWYRPADTIDALQLRRQIQSGVMTVAEAIDSVRPQHKMYAGLRSMLEQLEKRRSSKQVFVDTSKPLEFGEQGEHIVQLGQALQDHGDLSSDTQVSDVFDDGIQTAVKAFQSRHGLKADGIVTNKTLKALNTPITQRIEQVKANLERWRWFPAELENTNILVNIPEYRLHMSLEGNDIFSMDVVVGKPRHMTPVFSETMKFMEFAPTWTVPASITNEELLPLENRKPGYLASEEIDFYRRTSSGLVHVPRSQVTAEEMSMRPFPYVLRQRAGDKNVLGKVKFLMPNKHAIYLHDTQAKKLFGEKRRAFSHGCIRLSNPDLMAHVLLQVNGYDQSAVNEFMNLEETTRVNLDEPVPVHLAYFTAWMDGDGVMQFREDIYHQDERLINALQSLNKPTALTASNSGIQ